MKVTDYSKLANRYDKNKYRNKIGQDNYLKSYIEQNKCPEYHILDLACGTGIYLNKQMEFFQNKNIIWYGLDSSAEMLKKAGEKVPNALLINGVAENLPFGPGALDFIVNNYAFQHFAGKTEALDGVSRVLKTNGIFEMHNIAIHQMKNWWVYKYFPSAYYEDLKRFWDKDLIFHELSTRGFDVEINIIYQMQYMKAADLLDYANNRDISVLTLIDEKEYLKGLETLHSEVSTDSGRKIACDFAELYCIAKKL